MADESGLAERFEEMGARVRVTVLPANRAGRRWNGVGSWRGVPMSTAFRVDVRRDDRGAEYFDLTRRSDVDVQVLDVRPGDRHLLLMARELDQRGNKPREVKSKFLCGHD